MTCWSQQGLPCPGAAPQLPQAKGKTKNGAPRWERQRGEEGALSPPRVDKETLKRTEPSKGDGLQTLLSHRGTTLKSGTSVQGPSCPQELSAHVSPPVPALSHHGSPRASSRPHSAPPPCTNTPSSTSWHGSGPSAGVHRQHPPSSASWQRGRALPASPPLPGKWGKTS